MDDSRLSEAEEVEVEEALAAREAFWLLRDRRRYYCIVCPRRSFRTRIGLWWHKVWKGPIR